MGLFSEGLITEGNFALQNGLGLTTALNNKITNSNRLCAMGLYSGGLFIGRICASHSEISGGAGGIGIYAGRLLTFQ